MSRLKGAREDTHTSEIQYESKKKQKNMKVIWAITIHDHHDHCDCINCADCVDCIDCVACIDWNNWKSEKVSINDWQLTVGSQSDPRVVPESSQSGPIMERINGLSEKLQRKELLLELINYHLSVCFISSVSLVSVCTWNMLLLIDWTHYWLANIHFTKYMASRFISEQNICFKINFLFSLYPISVDSSK